MNNQVKTKPFGLNLASKIAAQAIKAEVAPVSTILGNLLLLQKSTSFPKDLDTHYFSFNKALPTEQDKKTIGLILGELRRPLNSVADMLESYVAKDWVVKKPPVAIKAKVAPKKINVVKKTAPKAKAVSPTIVIKKNKLN